jgi:hypothetical protein
MDILIGLAIATLLVIGWIYGNLFACAFLTLPLMLLFCLGLSDARRYRPATDRAAISGLLGTAQG